jgi:uncharacterized protein
MTALIMAALLMGVLGSFHCVGMCGPLVISLPLNNNSKRAKFFGAVLYNAGRVVTYAVFGLLFGLLGRSFALFGFQQWLSVILGVLIIVFVILPKRAASFEKPGVVFWLMEKLRSRLGNLFREKNQASFFTMGMLNGLLPCGLVYMAVAGAVATGDIAGSVLFMTFFGLGTLPVMWGVAFFGNYVSLRFRQSIRRAYPYMLLLMACLLILRGMGLGIPYVSPEMKAEQNKTINCCTKPVEAGECR